jgi:hypothetical protein
MTERAKLEAMLDREKLRVWVDAEMILAWRLDPDDTMPTQQVIEGHRAELEALYAEMLIDDVTIQRLTKTLTN